MESVSFPVGYHRFHRKQLYNFQLNRWHAMGYARYEDMVAAGRRIRRFKDWKREMTRLAEGALAEGRSLQAAFYYRAAEFYLKSDDPDKDRYYRKFRELFYHSYREASFHIAEVPFGGGYLPVIHVPPEGERVGTIVLHGGFDSFIEEFYRMMKYLAAHGYRVIGFEGPGQGAARRFHDLPFILEWERPLGAVLDHFQLMDVTLVGLSMGGWLCLRAAAFEPRVTRVIASGHAMEYMRSMPPVLRWVHEWCIRHCPGFMNRMARLKFEGREGMAPWMVDHLKYITMRDEPMDALQFYVEMNEANMHPERIRQDVMIMTGKEDHFIPLKMHDMQLEALTGARSVTGRVYTREEHAHNHCQCGNFGLALDDMIHWIREHTSDSTARDRNEEAE